MQKKLEKALSSLAESDESKPKKIGIGQCLAELASQRKGYDLTVVALTLIVFLNTGNALVAVTAIIGLTTLGVARLFIKSDALNSDARVINGKSTVQALYPSKKKGELTAPPRNRR